MLVSFFQKHSGGSKMVSHYRFKNGGFRAHSGLNHFRRGQCPSMWKSHHTRQLTPLWANDLENALRTVPSETVSLVWLFATYWMLFTCRVGFKLQHPDQNS